jgi:hypothetical protein
MEHVVARAHVSREELVSAPRCRSKRLQYFERSAEDHAFVAIERAGVGALVDHEHCRQNLLRRIPGERCVQRFEVKLDFLEIR